MDGTFITYASNILGETDEGLSGSKIVEYCTPFAVKYNIELPYPSYPFPKGTPNKRTALCKNILAFSKEARFELIKYLCDLPNFKDNDDVRDLRKALIGRFAGYGKVTFEDMELIQETKHWLSDYPDSLKLYEGSLSKYDNEVFERNALDDMRLSFELFLKGVLENGKSLENQIPIIGRKLKEEGVSLELRNMNEKIIDYYSKYQNTYVKHNDNVNRSEIEYIFELTSIMMRFIIRSIG
ncbi:hypothetical protein SAMN05192551_1223 [Tindallia magadiensis]|uniref:HEPN domain-containing protein n=1 Tax=Tindallia magadiensis TaxID=69895 RepID=A0A1I3I581_9FIRM|nr:hypothetical protein [Tindallia magadiensis]SFI43030.1 hypothetical protein SAMN05192551_1223 [Tindallia magadiensis]